MTNLSVELAPRHASGLSLKNPVLAASGTFGYGNEYAKLIDVNRLGAVVSKAITLRPREGNAQPRIAETPSGMLNAIGLQNVGLNVAVREKAPMWASWSVPVIANIAGFTVDEYVRVAETLSETPGVAAIELNISCPNVASEGEMFGLSGASAALVTREVRAVCDVPLLVKLSPNVTDIVEIARAVVDAGADALTLINTIPGMVIDVRRRQPYLANLTGGLSGPAIRPIAVRMVWQVAQAVDVPIVGVGGVASTDDALQFIMAGASAVQIGTGTFVNPGTMLDVVDGLQVFLESEGIEDVNDLIGVAARRAETNFEA
ncbi:MAG TPA: dihydroorotate dehydrogenase [Chloroflexota bacterium]|nr:dihydroorotate dehydrogenase [Chloroflexota bacterium]